MTPDLRLLLNQSLTLVITNVTNIFVILFVLTKCDVSPCIALEDTL
jgi:hypothetical protein